MEKLSDLLIRSDSLVGTKLGIGAKMSSSHFRSKSASVLFFFFSLCDHLNCFSLFFNLFFFFNSTLSVLPLPFFLPFMSLLTLSGSFPYMIREYCSYFSSISLSL